MSRSRSFIWLSAELSRPHLRLSTGRHQIVRIKLMLEESISTLKMMLPQSLPSNTWRLSTRSSPKLGSACSTIKKYGKLVAAIWTLSTRPNAKFVEGLSVTAEPQVAVTTVEVQSQLKCRVITLFGLLMKNSLEKLPNKFLLWAHLPYGVFENAYLWWGLTLVNGTNHFRSYWLDNELNAVFCCSIFKYMIWISKLLQQKYNVCK